jgi:hypothetical protein
MVRDADRDLRPCEGRDGADDRQNGVGRLSQTFFEQLVR